MNRSLQTGWIVGVVLLLGACASAPPSKVPMAERVVQVSPPEKSVVPEQIGSNALANKPASDEVPAQVTPPPTKAPVIEVPPEAPAPSPSIKVPPRIGLALGGGAARGFAHVGVIQVLEEAGIRPALVTGTSAGSLVAALYASGKNGAQLQHIAESMEEATIADWTLQVLSRGALRGEALAKYVNVQVGQKQIEALPMPLGIVATDLKSGERIVFRRGNTGQAVRASSSVPGVFQPVTIDGREFVDGGLTSPVPVKVARDMGADIVIAVDISQEPLRAKVQGTIDVLLQTFLIMGRTIAAQELQSADVVVSPATAELASANFDSRNLAILEGEKAALAAVPRIRERIAAREDRLRKAAQAAQAAQRLQ